MHLITCDDFSNVFNVFQARVNLTLVLNTVQILH